MPLSTILSEKALKPTFLGRLKRILGIGESVGSILFEKANSFLAYSLISTIIPSIARKARAAPKKKGAAGL